MTLIITLVLLLTCALVLARKLKMPRNVWLLFLAQPLALSVSPVMVFIGGILSSQIAPSPELATLPLSIMILSLAVATVPAAIIAKKQGRKFAFTVGLISSIIGTLIAALSAWFGHFYSFCLSAVFIGASLAFVMQFRFAVIDSVEHPDDIAKVVSALMFASIFAAFIGPELVVMGKDWIASQYGYVGSFLALTVAVLVALALVQGYQEPNIATTSTKPISRSVSQIMQQPIFIIALLAGAIGYGLMSLLMTATPISMNRMHGLSLVDTKWVIQSHIAAMYLPSLVTASLVKRFGLDKLFVVGVGCFVAVLILGLQGHHVMHYWFTLVMLGIAWNLLFLVGTVLLPQCYQGDEKHQVQAINDFTIFAIQAASSLLAGWIIFNFSWQSLIYACVPFVVIIALASGYYIRISSVSSTKV